MIPNILITYELPNQYPPGSDLLSTPTLMHPRSFQTLRIVMPAYYLAWHSGKLTANHHRLPIHSQRRKHEPRHRVLYPSMFIFVFILSKDSPLTFSLNLLTFALQYPHIPYQVYRRYKKHPILLIICIKISPATLLQHEFTPCPEHPFICIMALPIWDDSTVQELYLIGKQVAQESACAEDKLRALHVISEVHEKQYGKIMACLSEEPPNLRKALKHVEDAEAAMMIGVFAGHKERPTAVLDTTLNSRIWIDGSILYSQSRSFSLHQDAVRQRIEAVYHGHHYSVM
ncbi:hypothetical protein VTP01DRAFT_1341 [Rhizomucor pusillus]|uniref:uncharacterized protein n=1 Tax=Rhizomucor pusillus TaxID=4840 RepID=UPI003742CB8A